VTVVLAPLVHRRTPNRSTRHGARVDLLVWHETAGAYKGSVAWLCNPAAQASAHLVVREDGGEVTHAAAFNPRSVGVEHANVTAKGYATDAQLRESARIFGWLIAQSPRLFGQQIPPRWARGGNGPGVCYHGELGAAGGGHTACGPDHSGWLRFLDLLHAELKQGGYRKQWAT
jgi:hypothetical protein